MPNLRDLPSNGIGIVQRDDDRELERCECDGAADRVVTLIGTGTKLSRSPATLTFLTVGNGFSNVQNVTVSNAGPAGSGSTGPITATITGASSGVTFQITSNNCPAGGLAPGATCRIGVRFRANLPLTMGTATLNITPMRNPQR